jgi:hypothetical protein
MYMIWSEMRNRNRNKDRDRDIKRGEWERIRRGMEGEWKGNGRGRKNDDGDCESLAHLQAIINWQREKRGMR